MRGVWWKSNFQDLVTNFFLRYWKGGHVWLIQGFTTMTTEGHSLLNEFYNWNREICKFKGKNKFSFELSNYTSRSITKNSEFYSSTNTSVESRLGSNSCFGLAWLYHDGKTSSMWGKMYIKTREKLLGNE